jgi:hypothetical protein
MALLWEIKALKKLDVYLGFAVGQSKTVKSLSLDLQLGFSMANRNGESNLKMD